MRVRDEVKVISAVEAVARVVISRGDEHRGARWRRCPHGKSRGRGREVQRTEIGRGQSRGGGSDSTQPLDRVIAPTADDAPHRRRRGDHGRGIRDGRPRVLDRDLIFRREGIPRLEELLAYWRGRAGQGERRGRQRELESGQVEDVLEAEVGVLRRVSTCGRLNAQI